MAKWKFEMGGWKQVHDAPSPCGVSAEVNVNVADLETIILDNDCCDATNSSDAAADVRLGSNGLFAENTLFELTEARRTNTTLSVCKQLQQEMPTTKLCNSLDVADVNTDGLVKGSRDEIALGTASRDDVAVTEYIGGETFCNTLQSKVRHLRIAAAADISSMRIEIEQLREENKRLQDLLSFPDKVQVQRATTSLEDVNIEPVNTIDAEFVRVSRAELDNLKRVSKEYSVMEEELRNTIAHAENLAVEVTLEQELVRDLRRRLSCTEERAAALESDLSLVLNAKQQSEAALLQATQENDTVYELRVAHCTGAATVTCR